MYDTHVHSTFSRDGESTMEEYAALFDSGGFKGVGFAEHVDFLPECGSYGFLNPDRYILEIKSFRDRGYEFYAGGEIDYAGSVSGDISDHLKRFKYDFTVCSVHMIDGISISDKIRIPSIKDREILAGVIARYYTVLNNAVGTAGFDVLGHLGVYKRYLDEVFKNDRWLRSISEEGEFETAQLCARSDMIVEVNTSGLFSPLAETLPGMTFMKLYRSMGGRNVCVGSDAHNVRNVGKGIKAACDMLKGAGFDFVTLPWDRERPVMI